MTATGGLKAPAAPAQTWPRWSATNVRLALRRLMRPPRTQMRATWRSPWRLAVAAAIALAAVVLTMFFVDAAALGLAKNLPQWALDVFGNVTDFGKSGWFLVPIGLLLALIAALASPALARPSQLVLASVAVRLEFLFVAIAAPSLFATIVKRIIGRARPLVGGEPDPFRYMQFVWRPDYASLPSGHATTAFAAAVAIGLLWPRLRALMWTYALIIAVSRVALFAHHPSDVLAGAVVGAAGALLVRDWFAARRLAFVIGADGRVQRLPGPRLRA
jgi:undecaprenyl-diphosphatase